MGYKVLISQDAIMDLRAIYEYIFTTLGSPVNAERQLSSLREAIISLEEMPYRFRAYDVGRYKDSGLRIMVVDKYCVFYMPDDDGRVVRISRVIYGARDIPAVLE